MPRPPTFLVPREAARAEPWLISTNGELEREERERAKFSKQWLAAHPFPGPAADKVPWLAALQAKYDAQEQADWYQTCAPNPCDLVQETLLQHAPEKLWLQLKVYRNRLEKLKDWVPQNFSLPRYPGVENYPGEATWSGYCQYLLDQGGPEEQVVLAYVECGKDDEVMDALNEFLKATGLENLKVGVTTLGEKRVMEASSYQWGVQDLVGQNVYRQDDKNRFVVPLGLQLFAPSAVYLSNQAFYQELKAMKEHSKLQGQPKTYMLVPRESNSSSDEDEDDSEEEMAKTRYPLWLPYEFMTLNDRIFDHFVYGKGESARIKARLDKGNTDTGNLKVQMFEQELNNIKYSMNSIQSKFCAALTLLNAALYDNYWMCDNEYHEELPELVKDFATYLRTNLLKKSDRELGLGLEENSTGGHGLDEDMSESRRMLYSYLEGRSKEWQNYDGKIPFRWKPGKPRKRAAKNANVAATNSINKQAKTIA